MNQGSFFANKQLQPFPFYAHYFVLDDTVAFVFDKHKKIKVCSQLRPRSPSASCSMSLTKSNYNTFCMSYSFLCNNQRQYGKQMFNISKFSYNENVNPIWIYRVAQKFLDPCVRKLTECIYVQGKNQLRKSCGWFVIFAAPVNLYFIFKWKNNRISNDNATRNTKKT